MRVYRALSVVTAVAAYVLVLLDGLSRQPHAGFVASEPAHRLVARSVIVLAAFSVVAALRVRRSVHEAVGVAGVVAVLALLGGLTSELSTKWALTPAWVMVRVGAVILLLAGAVVQAAVALGGAHRSPVPVSSAFRWFVYGTAAATYVAILVGAYASSSSAVLVQVFHRAWALLVLLLVLAIAVGAARAEAVALAVAGRIAVFLLVVEIALGMLSTATPLSPFVRGSHLGVAAALFALLVGASIHARPLRSPEREAARPLKVPRELHTRRGLIRSLRPQDARAIWEVVEASRAQLAPWLPLLTRSRSLDEERARIIDLQAHWKRGDRLIFGLFDRSAGRLLGGGGFHRINWAARVFEVVGWIRPDAQGHWYAAEALRALTRLAFDQLGANRVEIRVAPANLSSRRLAERLGFVMEGTLRACVLDVDGRPEDRHVFALIREDYARLSWSTPAHQQRHV